MDTCLTGRSALVTGASQGIGRAVALALADAGARVWLNHLPSAAADAARLADSIAANGGAWMG